MLRRRPHNKLINSGSGVRRKTGATVVAIRSGSQIQVTLDPSQRLEAQGRMILVGTPAAEEAFMTLYKKNGN